MRIRAAVVEAAHGALTIEEIELAPPKAGDAVNGFHDGQ